MAKNFVQVGENLTLPVTNAVKSGDIVQVGEIVGIALTDAKTDDGTNHYTTLATKGVWEIPVSDAVAVGGVVSVKPTDGSKSIPVGFALQATESADIIPVLLCLGLAYGAENPTV